MSVPVPEENPLSIALLTYSSRPRGGVVHTLALAEALARAGQRVTVWTLARGGDTGFFRPVDPRVELRLVPFPDVDGETVGERVARSIALLSAAFEGQFDVVHAQDCISANAVPGRVRTVHHIDHFTTPQLAACHERAIREPLAHVCVSAAVAAELQAGWGISATVIPNGVDAARFATAAEDDAEILAERAAWQDTYGHYVIAVGGIEPRKGTHDLIRAMAHVQRQRPGTTLVVAGGETLFDYRDYRRAADILIDELGVDVEVLGPVEHALLPGLVAAAGAFAFPSIQEGFGLAAMEALAARVPVVVRDLPVLHEVFGAAVAYASDVESLAAQLLTALAEPGPSQPGADLANQYTWAAAASRHLRLYRQLRADGVPIGTGGSP